MLVNLSEIKSLQDPLKELIDKEIPIKTAYKLLKLVKVIDEESRNIEQVRIKMVKKYGEMTEDGKIIVSEENQKIFLKEYEDFLNTEIEIDIPSINIEELGDIKISIQSLSAIESILES